MNKNVCKITNQECSECTHSCDSKKRVPKECYEEFGQDLDGCSRQELGGCKGCFMLK